MHHDTQWPSANTNAGIDILVHDLTLKATRTFSHFHKRFSMNGTGQNILLHNQKHFGISSISRPSSILSAICNSTRASSQRNSKKILLHGCWKMRMDPITNAGTLSQRWVS